MKNHLFRFLPALLVLILLCGTAQATNLQITVQDSIDNITIPQATVYQDGVNVGRTTTSGTFLIVHSGLEDLNIRIAKSGYEDWENAVSMNATSVLANMTRKTLVLKVVLYDSDSFAVIPNAEVKLTYNNATDTKTSDSNGIVSFVVMANTIYDVAISAPYYQSQVPKAIEIGAENKVVQYWLMRNDRFSFIVTDPNKNPLQSAEIFIDSVSKGKTDVRGFLTVQIERGKSYDIEVKKDGYQSFVERKNIGDDDALMTVQIAKVPVGAFVSVYDENRAPVQGAVIYLDSAVAGNTDSYGNYVFGNIVAGSYNLEVRKDGYTTVKKTITISKQGDAFAIDLPYEQATVTVNVQDKDQKVIPDARVLVNGNAVGLTDANGQITAGLKFNTVSNITAQKEGYQTTSVQKSIIIGNASSSVTLIMERNLDWGFIALVVIGAGIIILVFAMIRRMSQKPGRHIIRRNEI
jgi:hypothetical protein